MRHVLLACMLLALLGSPAWAQTTVVTNPTTLFFTPSSNHTTVLSDGTALVARYELRLFLKGAALPVQVFDLGKPTPVADLITIVNPAWFTEIALNAEAVAKVAAIGPGGEGLSAASGPFVRLGPPGAPGAPGVK